MVKDGQQARVWQIVIALFAIVGFVGVLLGINTYLDRKIESRVSDPEFIRTIAAQVRPAVIFDSNGSILADLGAMQYFDEILVNLPLVHGKPGAIVLKPKILLTFPPEITGMGGAQIYPAARRGAGLTWRYEIDDVILMKGEVPKPYQFRLEVIK